MTDSYGITKRNDLVDEIQQIKESLQLKGYSIVKHVFTEHTINELRTSLDGILLHQEGQFTMAQLSSIKEENTVRMPFAYDPLFLQIVTHPLVSKVVESLLGNYYILHLQNGVVNKPSEVHHQVSWHRDLPYQDFVSSEPLGVNAFLCVDEFSAQSGATFFLPFSHKFSSFPSNAYVKENETQLIAPPGSILFFDSMLYHKAGINTGSFIRRGINTMFVRPILKQQIDIPELLQGKYAEDGTLKRILGYESSVARNVEEFRQRRINRISQ